MKTSHWGRTLLYTYKYLPRITEGIDKMVDRTAINSFFYCNNNQKNNNVLSVSDKLIRLIERKKKLINIRVLVDDCLLASQPLYAQILVEKYIDNDISDDIAKRHDINIRTYFRKLESAEASFYSHMVKRGFDEKKLFSYLSEEKWILEVYENFVKQDNESKKQEKSASSSDDENEEEMFAD